MSAKTTITVPDAQMAQQHPETLERLLIVGMIKSIYFYWMLRDKVCPMDEERQVRRPDFINPLYNKAFAIINLWWSGFNNNPPKRDLGLSAYHFECMLVDRVKKGLLTNEEALALKEEILPEIDRMEFTPELHAALATCEAFNLWLQTRATAYEIRELHRGLALKAATPEDLARAVERAKTSLLPTRNNLVNGGDAMLSSFTYHRPLRTGLDPLDKCLGGGIRPGEVTMVAAINAGGKSALAMQLALEFGKQQVNTILFTTEEPPIKLIPRMVSNYTSTDYGLFIDRQDINNAMAAGQQVAEVSVVPQVLWQNPGIYPQLQQLHTILNSYLYFVDWSQGQGYSIEAHFDLELEKVERLGWCPQVILFDWIGGGLAQIKDQDKLRHSYQTAVDHIVNYCKRTNRAAVVFAQLDKVKAHNGVKAARMNMLSENKTMTNNVANFIGISAIRHEDKVGEGKPLLQTRQYLNADKARYGCGGLVAVDQHFKFQRFTTAANARLIGEERKA